MKLLIGLGNPGKEYENTRHNAGFLALDYLAEHFMFPSFKFEKKFNAEISDGKLGRDRILFIKPQTFMNASGDSISSILKFFKINPDSVSLIHDDLDIPLGEHKLQTGRGSAGHKGVESVIDRLKTKNFPRVRIGIAPTDSSLSEKTEVFVLKKFTSQELKTLKNVFKDIAELLKKNAF